MPLNEVVVASLDEYGSVYENIYLMIEKTLSMRTVMLIGRIAKVATEVLKFSKKNMMWQIEKVSNCMNIKSR